MIDQKKIEREFRRIKNLGYIKSHRINNTGIGKTFEDYLGVDENNLKDPDFAGFEVKSQRQISKSYITLFTKSPSYPKGANAILKETFGKPDKKFTSIKVLHTSIFGDRFNTYSDKYGFKLNVNYQKERIDFIAKLLNKNQIIDKNIYWSFDDLKRSINKKLKALFVVLAETKIENGFEYFHYTEANVYLNIKFSKFLKAIESRSIMFDIRIGAYKTQGRPNFGKPHDHGSGFRIKRDNLQEIFEDMFNIK